MTIHAYAAAKPGAAFNPFEYEPAPLGHDEVEIAVQYCGICHSDLSMLDNEWGMTAYPFVGGHEVVGKVAAVGEHVPNLKVGDVVGLGWYARTCMHCRQCLGGNHHRCPRGQGTIVNRHGGFADRVRAHWAWCAKLPEGLHPRAAGPLFCGGITVFNPIVIHNLSPTARVGVIGIGGLGHMALLFLNKWGCEVTAFSTSADKEGEARAMGAHHFVNTKTPGALEKLAGRFDLVLNTANATLDWDAYVKTLAPGGILHTVGAVPKGFGVKDVFPMIMAERSLAASPLGPPAVIARMLDFCARHAIEPIIECAPLSDINAAFEKLRHGSPRYRLVLEA